MKGLYAAALGFEPGFILAEIAAESNSKIRHFSSIEKSWKSFNRFLLSLKICGFCYLTDINDGYSFDYIMGT